MEDWIGCVDLEFVDALRKLRVPISVVARITFLSNVDEQKGKELELQERRKKTWNGMLRIKNYG